MSPAIALVVLGAVHATLEVRYRRAGQLGADTAIGWESSFTKLDALL